MNNGQHNRYLFENALQEVKTNEEILTNYIVSEHELKEERQQLNEVLGTLLSLGLGAAVAAPVVHTVLDVVRHRKEKQAEAAKRAQEQANKDREHGLHQREIEQREKRAAEENKTKRQATAIDILQRRKEAAEKRRMAKKAHARQQDLLNKKLAIELAKRGTAVPPKPPKKAP